MKTDARDAKGLTLAEESYEHLVGLIGVGDKAAAIFLPKCGPAPEVGIYDQVAEVNPVRAVHPYDVFIWLQDEFLGTPT